MRGRKDGGSLDHRRSETIVAYRFGVRVMERIYTVPEVAKYLKMSKSKVYALVKREKIPYLRIGRNVRIRESDLNEWLEEQTRPGNPY